MSTIAKESDFTAHAAQEPASTAGPWESRFHATMAAASGAVIAISLYGYFFCNLTLAVHQAIPLACILLFLLAVAAHYRWRNEAKLFNLLMMVFWIVIVTNAHFFPMYMAARNDVPMNDAALAGIDRTMGLEVPTVMKALAGYPTFNSFMLFVYQSLVPLMTVATIVPPLLDRMDRAKQYIVSCIIAAAIAFPVFGFVQAVGPWDYYDFPPAIDSLSQKAGMLATLKADALFVIDVTNRDGLVTFPSFHVVLTVLAAAALWPFRWLRWPAAAWATLIVISTVTTGIHYTVDVLGGLAVAAVAHFAAKRYFRWEARRGESASFSAGAA